MGPFSNWFKEENIMGMRDATFTPRARNMIYNQLATKDDIARIERKLDQLLAQQQRKHPDANPE